MSSPLTILVYSAALGLFPLIFSGAFSRRLQIHDLFVALAWMVGAFAFMPIWLFLRGKTSERTLTVSLDGISAQIGSLQGEIPWSKVRFIADAGDHVLIARANGNAFFIPARAFQGPGHMAELIERITSWRSGAK